jgi:hypothetical protein
MKRLVLTASVTLAVAAPAHAGDIGVAVHRTRPGCAKTFTPAMGHRAADAIYAGTRHVTLRELRLLGYIERCQRNPRNQARVRSYDRHQDVLHRDRVAPPLSYAEAS